jgi:predicted kinase
MTRTLCRFLILLMAWTPFHLAHAGIISTDQAVYSAQTERSAVLNLINRSDVAAKLQSLGVDLASAKDRVAAMTDEEVRTLTANLHAAPAGGDGIVVLILVGVILWLVFFRK